MLRHFYRRAWVPFVPVTLTWVRGDPVYVDRPDLLTPQATEALVAEIRIWVPESDYRYEDGVLYIRRRVSDDPPKRYTVTMNALHVE